MTKSSINWPLTICATGFVITGIGELWGANRKQRNDTISEKFKSLPLWVKLMTFFGLGFICSHLAEWQIGAGDTTVNIEGDVNVDADES